LRAAHPLNPAPAHCVQQLPQAPSGKQYEVPMDNLDETAAVIAASKVTGTNVYNTDETISACLSL
jgi:hypothetical protein